MKWGRQGCWWVVAALVGLGWGCDAKDRCLDRGGCWVQAEERCEYEDQAKCDDNGTRTAAEPESPTPSEPTVPAEAPAQPDPPPMPPPQEYALPADLLTLPLAKVRWELPRHGQDTIVGDVLIRRLDKTGRKLAAHSLESAAQQWVETYDTLPPHYAEPAIKKLNVPLSGDRVALLARNKLLVANASSGEALKEVAAREVLQAMVLPGCQENACTLVTSQRTNPGKVTAIPLNGGTGWSRAHPDWANLMGVTRTRIVLLDLDHLSVLSATDGDDVGTLETSELVFGPDDIVVSCSRSGLLKVISLTPKPKVLWSRDYLDFMNAAIVGGDLVIFARRTLYRVALSTGEVKWRLNLSPDIGTWALSAGRPPPWVLLDDDTLLMSASARQSVSDFKLSRLPPVGLTIDWTTGTVRGAFIRPEGTLAHASNNTLLLAADGKTPPGANELNELWLGVDWRHLEPPLREKRGLRAELSRSLSMALNEPGLWLRYVDAPLDFDPVEAQSFPRNADDARGWVLRLWPLAPKAVEPKLLATLRKSYVKRPTLRAVQRRVSALEMLGTRLPMAEVGALRSASIQWLQWLLQQQRKRGEQCSSSEGWSTAPCQMMREVDTVVVQARDQIERTAKEPSAVAQFSDFARGLSGGAEKDSCAGATDEELALVALLRHEYNLDTATRPVVVEKQPCAPVFTLAGKLETTTDRSLRRKHQSVELPVWIRPNDERAAISATERDERFGMAALEPPYIPPLYLDEDLRRGDPEWDNAPTLLFHHWWKPGGLSGWGRIHALKKIRGEWRVVRTYQVWVS